jgi:hypothetical protein
MGQPVSELMVTSIEQVPTRQRRLELQCQHGKLRETLAFVTGDRLVTNLDVWRYPDDATTVEINCMTCRSRWQVSMLLLRGRVDGRRGFEKVLMSEVAQQAPWLD